MCNDNASVKKAEIQMFLFTECFNKVLYNLIESNVKFIRVNIKESIKEIHKYNARTELQVSQRHSNRWDCCYGCSEKSFFLHQL